MQISVVLLVSAALPAALATVHTECYNYFLKKDGCVFSAADARNRCNASTGKPPFHSVGKFERGPQHPVQLTKRSKLSLERRYTSENTNTSFAIDSGPGACGNYSTQEPGACLWVGSDAVSGADPATAGWLNGAKTSNCRKQLYIQRKGQPDFTVYVPVVDACRFYTRNVTIGCFQIAVTNKTFYDLNPTPQEIEQGHLGDLIWDYNNLFGKENEWGPV